MDHQFTLPPGKRFHLKEFDAGYTGRFKKKEEAEPHLAKNLARLRELQDMLYAQANQAVLIILQAMDAGGKDGAVKCVADTFNPQGVQVVSFKSPTDLERAHDFLWRIHQAAPRLGMVTVWNRSHYEDVLIARVRKFVPPKVWQKRYEHINNFERLLFDSGATILKFYLHISKEEQAKRLRERLENPTKQWKFQPGDMEERKFWDDYMAAYEEALTKCNTEFAPWHVIPADHKWRRNLALSEITVKAMEKMDLRYPDPHPDLARFAIPK